eukprot:Amastigsp_a174668_399.p4 type:complete len:114 gc:universal Amastigsp_a174668_399:810-469(-)
MMAPPTTSECPPRYFVDEWRTRSAPRAMGFWSAGVAKVLSTRTTHPWSWPRAASPRMSVTSRRGFVGVSAQTSLGFLSFLSARAYASTVPFSAKTTSSPHGLKILSMRRKVPP